MDDLTHLDSVWVFNGDGAHFPAAVFREKDSADVWIKSNRLSGILTKYPLDVSALDWCIAKGFFKPEGDDSADAAFKQKFSSAYQGHHHYEDGEQVG